MAGTIEAVTFDFWNTLVGEAIAGLSDARLTAWMTHLAEAGHDEVTEDAISKVFEVVWREHSAAWEANEQYTGERAARRAIALAGLDGDAALALDLEAAFIGAGDALALAPIDGVAAAIEDLARRGVRLGIICDVGFTPSVTLRNRLQSWGMLDWFTGWSFSDEVGHYKPAPEMFAHAFGYLGVPADRAAHVGDLRRTDVAGARASGWRSVRYRGHVDDRSDLPEADAVIDSYVDLPAALGWA